MITCTDCGEPSPTHRPSCLRSSGARRSQAVHEPSTASTAASTLLDVHVFPHDENAAAEFRRADGENRPQVELHITLGRDGLWATAHTGSPAADLELPGGGRDRLSAGKPVPLTAGASVHLGDYTLAILDRQTDVPMQRTQAAEQSAPGRPPPHPLSASG